MRVVAIIPARYHSSRFPGKPLADLCGKPMIWWVYNQVKKVSEIDEVYVATDDKRIEDVCNKQRINVVMTRDSILESVWGYDYTGDTRTVDTLIKQLRKKIAPYGNYIRSVYGVGYIFEGEENETTEA